MQLWSGVRLRTGTAASVAGQDIGVCQGCGWVDRVGKAELVIKEDRTPLAALSQGCLNTTYTYWT